MVRKRLLIHAAFLFALPIVVAWFGLGVVAATMLVLLMLLWRWLVVMSGIISPEKTPEMVLETIAASHFVEKARWCMDRLGVDYTERQSGGTLGAYFTGRSVPQLRVRTGTVQSVIGNSAEILRFLYGNYSGNADYSAGFLGPTARGRGPGTGPHSGCCSHYCRRCCGAASASTTRTMPRPCSSSRRRCPTSIPGWRMVAARFLVATESITLTSRSPRYPAHGCSRGAMAAVLRMTVVSSATRYSFCAA